MRQSRWQGKSIVSFQWLSIAPRAKAKLLPGGPSPPFLHRIRFFALLAPTPKGPAIGATCSSLDTGGDPPGRLCCSCPPPRSALGVYSEVPLTTRSEAGCCGSVIFCGDYFLLSNCHPVISINIRYISVPWLPSAFLRPSQDWKLHEAPSSLFSGQNLRQGLTHSSLLGTQTSLE